jgi:hypothetical protein
MTLQNLRTADGIPKAKFCPWAIPLIVPGITEFPKHLPGNSSADFRHQQTLNTRRGKEFLHAEAFAQSARQWHSGRVNFTAGQRRNKCAKQFISFGWDRAMDDVGLVPTARGSVASVRFPDVR